MKHSQRLVLSLLVVCFGLLGQRSWALSLGPALFMVQNVVPGQPLDVRKSSGVVFTINNSGDQEGTFSLSCYKPVEGGVMAWECGDDEIPDASWCKLDKNEMVIPAQSKAEVGLTIAIPDKPEYYDCKLVVVVVLKPGKLAGSGVGLSVAARVQIETASSDNAEAGKGVPLAATPCVTQLTGKPGELLERTVFLRNNTTRVLECVTQKLEDCYADKTSRYQRYTTFGYKALEQTTWLQEKEQRFSLKPGEKREYKLKVQIPSSAQPGEKREELVFITAPAPQPGATGAAGRETRTFFRLLYNVTADGAK